MCSLSTHLNNSESVAVDTVQNKSEMSLSPIKHQSTGNFPLKYESDHSHIKSETLSDFTLTDDSWHVKIETTRKSKVGGINSPNACEPLCNSSCISDYFTVNIESHSVLTVPIKQNQHFLADIKSVTLATDIQETSAGIKVSVPKCKPVRTIQIPNLQHHLADTVTTDFFDTNATQFSLFSESTSRDPEEYTFKCNHCVKSFNDMSHLTFHTKLFHSANPFQKRNYGNTSNFTEHISNFESDTLINQKFTNCNAQILNSKKEKEILSKCLVCAKTFPKSGRGYVKHCKEVHSVQFSYQCEMCSKVLYGNKRLLSHTRNHALDLKYTCENCAKIFKSEKGFKLHKQQYHSDNASPFVCNKCGLRYRDNSHFAEHMRTHDGEIYNCDRCDNTFITQVRLNNHINRVHLNKKKKKCPKILLKCNHCKKHLHSKPNLIYHMESIHGENLGCKKYSCLHCEKKFKSKQLLEDHENYHTGNKPYKCTVCNKGFTKHGARQRHMLIHSGCRPYKCDVCDMHFNQNTSLTRHQVVHTGERPYACGICGQRFTQKPYMKLHERTKHGDSSYLADSLDRQKEKSDD